ASGAVNYSWSPNAGLSTISNDSVYAYPNSTTMYTVQATDANGCTGSASTLIDVTAQIEVIASKNKDVECNGNVVQLSATGAQNYAWSPASILSQPNNANTSAQIENTITFYVTGSLGSCVDADSITVQVINSDASTIFIPNVFSPNDDNLNDCFRLSYKENYSKFYFTIYNRWGQKVFESNSQNFCWDGSLNGVPQMVGTYYYYLQIESNCGKVIRKGDILLVR
ncbi:MAG TPA: gliding motility-associated C-terminal domain-containing protein, partial [Chitinophagaceae bacterium]|nr:gliding motility-associated C-terminal domain-containing protein [Chitinophagaceae bacterium]